MFTYVQEYRPAFFIHFLIFVNRSIYFDNKLTFIAIEIINEMDCFVPAPPLQTNFERGLGGEAVFSNTRVTVLQAR